MPLTSHFAAAIIKDTTNLLEQSQPLPDSEARCLRNVTHSNLLVLFLDSGRDHEEGAKREGCSSLRSKNLRTIQKGLVNELDPLATSRAAMLGIRFAFSRCIW